MWDKFSFGEEGEEVIFEESKSWLLDIFSFNKPQVASMIHEEEKKIRGR